MRSSKRYYARAAGHLLGPESPLRFYVARREGKPVAAVEIAQSAGTLGVYNLSTRREHRNAGIGAALLAAALKTEQGRPAHARCAPGGGGGYGPLPPARLRGIRPYRGTQARSQCPIRYIM